MEEKLFRRGNGTSVSYDEMTTIIADYIATAPNYEYEITVGTDSQNHSRTKIVEVICIHRVGDGGIFFYYVEYVNKIRTLKNKIIEETSRSINNATGLIDEVSVKLIDYNIKFIAILVIMVKLRHLSRRLQLGLSLWVTKP